MASIGLLVSVRENGGEPVGSELARDGLHRFMAGTQPFRQIILWSRTGVFRTRRIARKRAPTQAPCLALLQQQLWPYVPVFCGSSVRPRCLCLCGKRACPRRLAHLQQPLRPWAPVFVGAALAAMPFSWCSNRAGLARKRISKGTSCFYAAAPTTMLCSPAIAPAAAHRAQARPGVSCCRCRDAGWIRIGAQRRWRIHAYSGSPASTSTTPQSSASLPTPITA